MTNRKKKFVPKEKKKIILDDYAGKDLSSSEIIDKHGVTIKDLTNWRNNKQLLSNLGFTKSQFKHRIGEKGVYAKIPKKKSAANKDGGETESKSSVMDFPVRFCPCCGTDIVNVAIAMELTRK